MKKLRISHPARLERILDGTACSIYELECFRWATTPQGHTYWFQKSNAAYRLYRTGGGYYKPGIGYVKDGLWDEIITEEDRAYFRAATRDQRKFKDKFLTVKKHKEYVDYVDELVQSEIPQE